MRLIRFKLAVFITALLMAQNALAEEKQNAASSDSDQQISDFSLSGYAEKGKKSWDLAGKSADIFTDTVKLKEVVGNMYGESENIKLTADEGDFNKAQGKVHLEQNVVITTSSGAKMTTDELDWDRKNQLVTTDSVVNIERDNMVTVGRGAKGEPNLKKVALEKDVKVDIKPDDKGGAGSVKEKIAITCDGPLEIDYEKNIASFNNNVKVERTDATIYSDKMDIYFIPSKKEEAAVATGATDESKKETAAIAKDEPKKEAGQSPGIMGSKIDKIVARGNVKVVRGENISYSEEAIYTASDKKIILTGRPKLILYTTEGLDDASFGN